MDELNFKPAAAGGIGAMRQRPAVGPGSRGPRSRELAIIGPFTRPNRARAGWRGHAGPMRSATIFAESATRGRPPPG